MLGRNGREGREGGKAGSAQERSTPGAAAGAQGAAGDALCPGELPAVPPCCLRDLPRLCPIEPLTLLCLAGSCQTSASHPIVARILITI